MTAKRPRGRPAIPKEVQRQRLVDAALRAIQKSHYEKVSVAVIVREAGMSSRSFYDHFVSKEDLIAEIVNDQGQRLMAKLEQIFHETKDDRERVERAMQAFLELFPAGTIDLERLGGEAGQRVRELRQVYVMALTDLVLRQYEKAYERRLVARVPLRSEIELVLTGIEGLSFRYYSEGRRAELLKLHPVLLQLFLRALT
ncbi:MAG TPA: TetR/AcrR family transcriptional regulator [Myxococcota bacterium]|nr:TetR/AcrR family transcriptional regulator [Myxococcota bacterium]